MVCGYCSGETEVINSRAQRRNNQVWRRRRCLSCGALFTTHEAIFMPTAFSVIRGNKTETFMPDKLFTEILLAVADRKDCYEAAREVTATIMQNLLKDAQTPLFSPQTISQEAAQVLKRLDKQAWMRYSAEHPSLHD